MRALIISAHQADMTFTVFMEMPANRFADSLVVEAHRHVDRLRREIPGLHDGNAGGEKAPAALLGVRHAS